MFLNEKDYRKGCTCVSSLMTPREASSLLDPRLLMVHLEAASENWKMLPSEDTFQGLNLTVGHMRQSLLSPSLHLFLSPKSSVSMKRPEDAISSSLSLCQAAILRGSSLLNSA
ncbi:hypothetical protein DPX16_19367 [Anabarilius grahami]|uniref:Uncharacterized protein n=1 Tax=Anabarilius grahami TaxID=495550 RepID=A0A3N0Z1Q4_ANAGA|nr:hypothetical protein DPX16_19367 [Anabarilius grahami]